MNSGILIFKVNTVILPENERKQVVSFLKESNYSYVKLSCFCKLFASLLPFLQLKKSYKPICIQWALLYHFSTGPT